MRFAPEGIWAEISKKRRLVQVLKTRHPFLVHITQKPQLYHHDGRQTPCGPAATVVAAPEVGRGSLRSSAALSKLRGSIMATVLLLQQLTRVKKKKKKFMSFSG